MDNRVGDKLPSETEIAKQIQQIDAIRKPSESWGVSLTPEERRSRLRFRPGGEKIVADVARLAQKYGADNPDTPVAGMQADLTLAQRIAPVAAAARALADRLDDTLMAAESECWQAATALYSQLSERGKHNPDLARELADVKAFFATGRRKRGENPEAK